MPTDAEWTVLTDFLGGEAVAGCKLKEAGLAHWLEPNASTTNETGFSALPGGYRYLHGAFLGIGDFGYWWSSTETGATSAGCRGLNAGGSFSEGGTDKRYGFSVRCIGDY